VRSGFESVEIWVDASATVTTSAYNEIGRDIWGGRMVLTSTVELHGKELRLANHHGCLGQTNSGCSFGGQPAIFHELEQRGFFDGEFPIFLCDCNDMQSHMDKFCDKGFSYQKVQGGPLSGFDNIAFGNSLSHVKSYQFDGRGWGGASDHQGLLMDLNFKTACSGACATCEASDPAVCTSCRPGDVLSGGQCTTGACDEAGWPDIDHGLVCGDCKVLVNNFQATYQTCDGYCQSLNLQCVGAWDEVLDTCQELNTMMCDETLDSSDAICQCGPSSATPESSPTTTEASHAATCSESQWPDLDHNLVCGDCKVLVDEFDSKYGTCEGYCGRLGLTCAGAWEEENDGCGVLYDLACDQTLSSSDAICQCDPQTAQPGCGQEPPAGCMAHINWAHNTGKNTNPEYYNDFALATGVSLGDSTMEDMKVYFKCVDTGHEECADIRLPCGRKCLNFVNV